MVKTRKQSGTRRKSTYDIRGNLLTVTDALDRLAFEHIYDLGDNPLQIKNIDAGVRRTILDGAGNDIERRDSKGSLILQAYDALQRPIRLWARNNDNSGEPVTLREQLVYGDEGDRDANLNLNRLGKLTQHFDEAGLLSFDAYDFKGNTLEKVRQVVKDSRIDESLRVDWERETLKSLVDLTRFETSYTYDALNRIKSLRYPRDVEK